MPPTVPRLQVSEYKKVESLRAWQKCGGVIPAVGIGCFAFGTPLQHRHAIRVRCGFGKTTIVDSLKKGRLDSGYISAFGWITVEQSGLLTRIAVTENVSL